MKKQLLLILAYVTTSLLFPQSSYFNLAETNSVPDINNNSTIEAVYITSNEEVAVAFAGKKKLFFNIFNADGDQTFNMFKSLEKKEEIIGHVKGDMTLKVFTVAKPSKTERALKCHTLDLKSKTLQTKSLFQTTVEKKQALFSGQNKRQTNFSVSPKGSFLAIATDNIKKHSNSYNIHVYDASSLDLVYEKEFFENPENFFKSFDMSIDDSGIVYSVGKEYKKGRKEKTGDDPNYSIVIHRISNNDNTSSRIELDGNQHIADLKIILKENRLDLYGFYSKEKSGRIAGLSKITLDKNNVQNYQFKQTKLPETVLRDIYSEEKAKQKQEEDLKNYYLDYVIEDEYGNTTLLAEEFFITQTFVNNGQYGMYTVTNFHYNNILIIHLNDRGDVVWGRSIFKTAYEPSYNAFISGEKLHVLLNTGKKLKIKNDGRVKARKGLLQSTALFDYVYDMDGTVVQEKLRENKGKTNYQPRNGAYQNGKFIMLNDSAANKSLMILTPKGD